MSRLRHQLWKARLAARGKYLARLRQLRDAERLEPAALSRLQELGLERVLSHAHDHTVYYSELLANAGVVRSDRSLELANFQELPLLDKTTLMERWEDLKAVDAGGRREYVTWSGGSTGERARFLQDTEFHACTIASALQFDLWTGYRSGERKAVLWGSRGEIAGGPIPWRDRIGRWLRNELWLRSFGLTEDDLRSHARAINAFRPVQILAYVESIYELARAAEEAGIEMHSPRAVMTSAGTLYPSMRRTIERVFEAPVFNRYGSTEVGAIASECDQHRGLHVSAPCQYVEILLPDGTPAAPGQEGEIVITNLTNLSMPLIRYRIGDVGSWAAEPCPCGRHWPLLETVAGRVSDTFINRDGVQVEGKYFMFILAHDWVRRYRVVQETVDEIDITVQPLRPVREEDQSDMEAIRTRIREMLGTDVNVKITVVPEIEPTPSGKHLYVLSKVRSAEGSRR